MKLQKCFTIAFICALTIAVNAQTNGSDNANTAFTRVTPIQKETSAIGANEPTSIKAFWKQINDDGSAFIDEYGRLFTMKNNSVEVTELHATRAWFAHSSNSLLYWHSLDNYNKELVFYDWVEKKVVRTFQFSIFPNYLIREASNDGSTIVLDTNSSPGIVYSQFNGEYVKFEFNSIDLLRSMVSQNGSRIFFSQKDDANQPDWESKYYYIEKTKDGWSEKKGVPGLVEISAFLYGNTESMLMTPCALANNGKTLILRSNRNQLAQIHEVDGKWSEPEIIGDFQLTPTYSAIFPVYTSDDGNVIAIEQAIESAAEGPYTVYDLFVFTKNQAGRWSKHQVNPPNMGVWSGSSLSRDGSKIFWIPEMALSGVNPVDYR